METSKIAHALKEHWPWAVGGVVGLYVIFHYIGGSNSGGATNDSAALASMAATGAAAAAQNQNYQLAQGQLAAQSTAAGQAAQVALTSAIGDVALKTGTSIGSVIAAQSALPAAAINAANQSHQVALASAAGVAVAGINVLPDTYNSLGKNQAIAHETLLGYAGSLVDMTDSLGKLGFAAFNGISMTTAPATSSAAAAAAAGAAANASATGAEMGALSHVADAVAKMYGGGMV